MTKLIAISGSLRKQSYNTGLIDAMLGLGLESIEIEKITLNDIPLYNGDTEKAGIPKAVTVIQQKIQAADGVLLVTPEYNHSIPGVLKNALDWLSRPKPDPTFAGLPLAILGATPGGFGTISSQAHWLQPLQFLKTRLWTEQQLLISGIHHKANEAGQLTDAETLQRLKEFIEGFAAFAVARPRR